MTLHTHLVKRPEKADMPPLGQAAQNHMPAHMNVLGSLYVSST